MVHGAYAPWPLLVYRRHVVYIIKLLDGISIKRLKLAPEVIHFSGWSLWWRGTEH